MKHKTKVIALITCIVVTILLSVTVFSQAITQNIEVVFNSINITVNGQKVDTENILYNGTTYVPLRAVSNLLNKNVTWNESTNTAGINDKLDKINTSVIRVVDGDTIKVVINGKEESIRLIGVDTAESVHPDATKNTELGKIASQYSKDRLEGKEVSLEFDVQERDKYGRLLAYVYIDNKMYNAELIEKGMAKIMTIPPNVKYVDLFTKLQSEARDNKLGIWAENISSTETSNTEHRYVGSKESNKYHNPNCRWAEKINKENEIWFDSIEDAKFQGYEPCAVCNPK